jgi:crescentin
MMDAFLGRKSAPADAKPAPVVIAGGRDANGKPDLPELENPSAQIGKEHEAVLAMLGDATRRINGLDLVKEAHDRLAEPIVKALRALEQEKGQNAALRSMLSGACASRDKHRAELDVSKRQIGLLEATHAKLREDFDLAQEHIRALDAKRQMLAEDVAARRDENVNLGRQLFQESSERQRLVESQRALTQQIADAEKRIVGLEMETASTREKATLTAAELSSVQKSFEATLAENSKLSRRVTEAESELAEARSQIVKLGTTAAAASAERDRVANALDDANGRHQAELHAVNVRFEALQSRAMSAEKLLTETRQALIARTEEARNFDRRHVETMIVLNAANKKLSEFETALREAENQLSDSEQIRDAMNERTSGLARNLQERETALGRAEVSIQTLTGRIAKLESELEAVQAACEKRVEELEAELNRERVERSIVEGALQAARGNGAAKEDMDAAPDLHVVAPDLPFAASGR